LPDTKQQKHFVFAEYEKDDGDVEEWAGRVHAIEKIVAKSLIKVVKKQSNELALLKSEIDERLDQ